MQLIPNLTIVKALMKIRRERVLTQPGEVVARPGQQVTPVQVVARALQQKSVTVIPAAELLGVPAGQLGKYLLVEEGAAIQKGTPLVRKTGLLGNRRRINAPVDGVLYQVSNGRLILQQTPDLVEIRAMMHGFVIGLVSNRGVMIETFGSLIQAIWGSGREGYGKIKVATETADTPLRVEHIKADARGTILVGGHLNRTDVLDKAGDSSVRGFIVGSVPESMLSVLEEFLLPIIVTDGFSNVPMSEPIFRLLQQSEGREASLFGKMGDSRPEIIVPLPVNEETDKTPPVRTLAVGQTVRILRAPYTGRVGQVVNIHTQSYLTNIGLRVAGADVSLPDGQVVFVPYMNLDLLG